MNDEQLALHENPNATIHTSKEQKTILSANSLMAGPRLTKRKQKKNKPLINSIKYVNKNVNARTTSVLIEHLSYCVRSKLTLKLR